MSKTVEQGFLELKKRLNPKYAEPEFSEANLNLIERCLNSELEMEYLIQFGSIGHGTNIDGFSGIDCFAVIPKAKLHPNSNHSVQKVQQILGQHFSETTILEGRPAVAIPFGERASDRHFVVPAYAVNGSKGHEIFSIPGPSGRWIQSCPGGHSAWINQLNDQLNKKLRDMIRIAKAWNYLNGQPVWSFYLEQSVVDFLKNGVSNSYAVDMRNYLRYLLKRQLAPYEKSIGTNEPVYATARKDRETALQKIEKSAAYADNAVEVNQNGDVSRAYSFWRKAFNFHFPAF